MMVPTRKNIGVNKINKPEYMLIKRKKENPINSIVKGIYPSFYWHLNDPTYLQECAILAPTLDIMEEVNDYLISLNLNDERIYYSQDLVCQSDTITNIFTNLHSLEFLNTIKYSGLPLHELKLNISIQSMLLRNIDYSAGLCNGTRLILT